MAAVKDILLDDDDDLLISNGDLTVGNSDDQHISLLLTASKGEYKQFPLCGADIIKDLSGPFSYDIINKIKTQLIADGYKVNNVSYINEEIQVNAERI